MKKYWIGCSSWRILGILKFIAEYIWIHANCAYAKLIEAGTKILSSAFSLLLVARFESVLNLFVWLFFLHLVSKFEFNVLKTCWYYRSMFGGRLYLVLQSRDLLWIFLDLQLRWLNRPLTQAKGSKGLDNSYDKVLQAVTICWEPCYNQAWQKVNNKTWHISIRWQSALGACSISLTLALHTSWAFSIFWATVLNTIKYIYICSIGVRWFQMCWIIKIWTSVDFSRLQ